MLLEQCSFLEMDYCLQSVQKDNVGKSRVWVLFAVGEVDFWNVWIFSDKRLNIFGKRIQDPSRKGVLIGFQVYAEIHFWAQQSEEVSK
jgi:hypothetical protein